MAVSVRIVIPTRGPSPALSRLEADLDRERQAHPEIPVTVRVTSGGSAAVNRNRGATGATEEWLQFLDDDLRLPPGWLSHLNTALSSPHAPDLLGGSVGSLQAGNWFSQAAEDFVVRHKEYPEGWYLVSAHLAVRRHVFEQLGGFDESFASAGGEDWDLCRRAHQLGFTVGVTDQVRCLHANPTNWRGLAARARAYGRSSIGLDGPTVDTAESETPSDNPPSSTSDPPPTHTDVQRTQRPLLRRVASWPVTEYRTLRRQGRSRRRSARSTALYVPWMAIYLRERHRIASAQRDHD